MNLISKDNLTDWRDSLISVSHRLQRSLTSAVTVSIIDDHDNSENKNLKVSPSLSLYKLINMISLLLKPFLFLAEGFIILKLFCLNFKDLYFPTVEYIRRGHAGTSSLSQLQTPAATFASLLYSSSSWAHRHCLSAHHPHLMLPDLLFIRLRCLVMWNTSPINNWVMLCSPLGGGLRCSGEIKGALWRLRHRSGTWSPWALWKQKREITGNREIGKKINKICLAGSDGVGRWHVKQENGTWKAGREQDLSSVR